VDLGVSTRVAGLVLSAQADVPDLKILVGDSASPLANSECAVGVQIAANTSFAQVPAVTHGDCSFCTPSSVWRPLEPVIAS